MDTLCIEPGIENDNLGMILYCVIVFHNDLAGVRCGAHKYF
jgi:hypothetical protein